MKGGGRVDQRVSDRSIGYDIFVLYFSLLWVEAGLCRDTVETVTCTEYRVQHCTPLGGFIKDKY
jgi:hypothetical protein